MITIDIPGFKNLRLAYLVLDYNGTLACDGRFLEGVPDRLEALSRQLGVHILTADTFGLVRQQAEGLSCQVTVLPPGNEAAAKLIFVEGLGCDQTVCIGNGRNDRLMLQDAALGIAVLEGEGAAVESWGAADVVASRITDALDLLLNPLRLKATLRS